jgi:SAM domain (Sterile alpha motif)
MVVDGRETGWLRSLGLEKYEAVLRDSEIDEAVLHNLTEDHLRELGFPLGADAAANI